MSTGHKPAGHVELAGSIISFSRKKKKALLMPCTCEKKIFGRIKSFEIKKP